MHEYIDWTISIGNILTLIAMFSTVGVCLVKMGRYMQRLDDFMGKQTEINQGRTKQFDVINQELTKLNEILRSIAVQETRLNLHDKVIDELRRGVGWIVPPSV